MKNKLCLLTLLCLLAINLTLNASTIPAPPRRAVAVTFDDLPFVGRHRDAAGKLEVTRRLLKTIKTYNVPAIGFVNENKLLADGRQDGRLVALLQMWVDAGLELGNHSYSHPDLNNTPLDAYQEDIVRGEPVTRRLLEGRGLRLRYFRHPFLHAGRDLDTKQKLEAFLAGRGYRVAPVTIDNSEWIFARAYDNAAGRGDRRMMRRIGEAYVPYMENKFDYFERQSVALFDREIKQVLLLHANALNGDYFDEVARMIKRRGYRFITLDEALGEPAYDSPDMYAGTAGITWLHRWAISMGARNKIVKDEPATPAFVLKEAGVASE